MGEKKKYTVKKVPKKNENKDVKQETAPKEEKKVESPKTKVEDHNKENVKKFEVKKGPKVVKTEHKNKTEIQKKTANTNKTETKKSEVNKVEHKTVQPAQTVQDTQQETIEKKDEKPKFQKVQQQKKKKGGKKGIVFFLFLLIIAGLVYAWFYIPEFKNLFNIGGQSSSSTTAVDDKQLDGAQEWEKTYVKILKEKYNYSEIKDFKIQLLTLNEGDKIPALVATYKIDKENEETVLDMWLTDENGEIVVTAEKYNASDDVIRVLYDVQTEKYNWYLYYEDKDQKSYGSLSRLAKETQKSKQDGTQEKYSLYDYVISSKLSLSNISEEKFDQKFIKLDKDNLTKTWVEYKSNVSTSETLEIIKKEYNKKRTAREVVADYAKERVLDQAEELQKKAELAKTQLTIGERSLKYGTYIAKANETSEVTLVITASNTCSYIGVAPDGSQNEIQSTGVYNIKANQENDDGTKTNKIEISLKNGTKAEFTVNENDKFSNQWLEFTFKESNVKENEKTNNVTETTNTESNTNVTENTTTIESNNTVNNLENKTENNTNTETNTTPITTNTANQVDIGKDEALKLVQKTFGTNTEGKKIGYYYLACVKDVLGNRYYAYRISSLVDESHYTFVNTVLVSANGKTYREVSTPENFEEGQTVTKFDTEKSF